MDLIGLAEMDLSGCHQADAEMVMVLVAAVQEGPAGACPRLTALRAS